MSLTHQIDWKTYLLMMDLLSFKSNKKYILEIFIVLGCCKYFRMGLVIIITAKNSEWLEMGLQENAAKSKSFIAWTSKICVLNIAN